MALFAIAHEVLHKHDLHKLDVHFRKLARIAVGVPGGVDWSLPWHEILHVWHERLSNFQDIAQVSTWSVVALHRYRFFASYVATLPETRLLKRILHWKPTGTRKQGRPRSQWADRVQRFCEENNLGNWYDAAQDRKAWSSIVDDFVTQSLF